MATSQKTSTQSQRNSAKLREIAAAFREYHRVFLRANAAAAHDRKVWADLVFEKRRAALAALDLTAKNLQLLHRCREAFGCTSDTRKCLNELEEWASLTAAQKAEGMNDPAQSTAIGWYALEFEAYVAAGKPNPWLQELERWADEAERTELADGVPTKKSKRSIWQRFIESISFGVTKGTLDHLDKR